MKHVLNLSMMNFLTVIIAFNWKQQNDKVMSIHNIYVTVLILCWPHSTIKIINCKLFIMQKGIMCKFIYILPMPILAVLLIKLRSYKQILIFLHIFAHSHSGCFVDFWGKGNCQNGHNWGCPPVNTSSYAIHSDQYNVK